jgi:hypothetical protein
MTSQMLEAKRIALFWTGLLCVAVASFCLLHSEILLGDPDLWWHIVTGQGILQTWHVPYTDTYSYTFAGQAWIAKEWLSQVFLALAYNAAGWSGVLVLASLLAAAALGLLHHELGKHLHPTLALVLSVIVAMSMISITIARPHIFTFALLVFFTTRMFRAAEENRSPELWLLALITLWTNLHGSFTISFVVAGFAFLYLIEKHGLKHRTIIGKWILFGIFCPLAALINPYGLEPFLVNKTLLSGIQAMSVIIEWQPFNAQESLFFEGLVLLSIGLIWRTRPQLALSKVLFMLFALHMMLTHIRFIYVYFLLIPIIVAREVALQNPKISIMAYANRTRDNVEKFFIQYYRPIVAAIATLAALAILIPAIKTPFVPPPDRNVTGAFAYIKSHNLKGPVFNAYNLGGPLIMQGVKTYIDGRADQIFQGDFFKKFIATETAGSEKSIDDILQTNKVTWTIFPPAAYQNTYLASLPDWKKTYEDHDAVIYERVN